MASGSYPPAPVAGSNTPTVKPRSEALLAASNAGYEDCVRRAAGIGRIASPPIVPTSRIVTRCAGQARRKVVLKRYHATGITDSPSRRSVALPAPTAKVAVRAAGRVLAPRTAHRPGAERT